MELYIIRHGETVWNKDRRLQGSNDIDLNENGREIAIKTGEKFKDIYFDKIYASPLKRAYDTACLIRGDRDIEIVKDDRLREMCFGKLEGQNMDEMSKNPYSQYQNLFDAPEKYEPDESGENFFDVCKRTKDFMEKVIIPEADSLTRVMIVGHGAMNKGILTYIRGNGIDEFWEGGVQGNCEAVIAEYVNDTFHLINA